MYMPQHECGTQLTTFGGWLSPSTPTWVPRIKLGPSDLSSKYCYPLRHLAHPPSGS